MSTHPTNTPERFTKKRQSISLLVFSIALAAVFLYLALRGVDWVSIWNTLVHGQYIYFLIIIPIVLINYLFRAIRWSLLVRSEGKVPLLSVFWANMVGYMGNTFLPARAGELLRSGFLGRKTGQGMSFVLATALVERLMDVVALVLIGSVAWLIQRGITSELRTALLIMAGIGLAGLIILLIAPFHQEFILRMIQKIPFSAKISCFITGQVSRFVDGMRSLHSLRRLSLFIFFTVIIWLVDGLTTMIGVHIIFKSLSLGQALILLAALGLSSAIPSTPGYIGIYQFVAVQVLVPFGFTRSEAIAFILISQVMNMVIVSVFGMLGLWQINQDKGIPPNEVPLPEEN